MAHKQSLKERPATESTPMDPQSHQNKVLDKDGNAQQDGQHQPTQDGSGTQPDGGAGNSSGGHEQ